jgi:hypothetical protein
MPVLPTRQFCCGTPINDAPVANVAKDVMIAIFAEMLAHYQQLEYYT